MDKATTAELIEFILESLRLVNRRFSGITSSDDFLDTDEGLDKDEKLEELKQKILKLQTYVK